ncbi:MAG TPA: aspartate kinase [Blastocatellia bacterium]|nr:aspartate kinase [Blastocatellia bacterium]
MIVMKFGGTSVEDASCIERVAEIIRTRLDPHPVVVVSAMGKTTQRLLDAAEASAAGDSRTTLGLVATLRASHLTEAARLFSRDTTGQSVALVERYFDELAKLLEGLAILGEVPPRGLDKILAYGELLSSAILAGALNQRGIGAELMDARKIIKTDDRYGSASPIVDLTDRYVRKTIEPVVSSGKVPVLQGYIGSTREGATTTLGFEGSDYTAAVVAAALEARDIEIWKDVPGLMTADPALFSNARTVKRCSYDEAAELTYFGAKVLHQKAVYPAAAKQIPVHIYNSKDMSAAGTEITADPGSCVNLVKSIAYKRPVSVIRLRTRLAAGGAISTDDLFKAALDVLAAKRVPRLLTAASESGVVMIVDSAALAGDRGRFIYERLSGIGEVHVESERGVVSLVGDGLGNSGRLPLDTLSSLGEIRGEMLFHGPSPRTVSIVVGESEVKDVVADLHNTLFAEIDERVFC